MSINPNLHSEYDIVIAGGGTAGCLIAGRLAASHPDLKIVVLEAGPSAENMPSHYQPGRYLHHLAPTSKVVRFHVGEKSDALRGRQPIVPTGACLGGGSSVNFMMYTRASASDYDDWENVWGNPGWGSKDLLPLLEKVETYQVNPNAPTHGTDGPLKVSYGGIYTNVGKQFLDVAQEFDPDRQVDENADTNNLKDVNVYCRWKKWIGGETGRRSDVATHFIHNRAHNLKNLHIMTGVHVKRVLFEGTRATAVEYVRNPSVWPDADSKEIHTVWAKMTVVVTAGTFGSPGILERSGIGAKHILQNHDIKAAFGTDADYPGVGQNYQDHHLLFIPFLASEEAETLDGIIRMDPDTSAIAEEEWAKSGKGVLASNGIDAGIKFRPNEKELKEIGPIFKSRWDEYFAGSPDKPPFVMAALSMLLSDPTLMAPRNYFSMAFFSGYPMAEGHVHISSAEDPVADVDFRSGFMDDQADVDLLVWAYKRAREFARRMPIFRGEVASLHPKFPVGSKAAIIEDSKPFSINSSTVEYTQADDNAVENFVRENAQTTWHSLGTCAMKPWEKNGVVDSRLRVYGTEGLRVADMSICPSNVGSNTYSTALTIAEKAVLLLEEDLKLNA